MLIYLISFLEALANGLIMVDTTLYFKFVLKLTETQAASIISGMGILGSVLILLLGPMVDRIGVKKAMIIGALTLALGRLGLGFSASVPLTVGLLVMMAIGSSIKGSSVLIALRNQDGSFKLDYVMINIGYCLAGFLFDFIHSYSLTFVVAGAITAINLAVVLLRKDNSVKVDKPKSALSYDPATLKLVTLYNTIMIPVTSIFAFMSMFVPKWALAALGPDAPIGKLYESLNPAIIMIVVPLFGYFALKHKFNPYISAVVGTTISALSMFFILVPGGWLISAIATISIFTIGEAIWSPANMEVGTKLCPPGEEGKYLTISLIPRTLVGFFMSYAIAFGFNHFIYVTTPNYWIAFVAVGLFSLLTPVGMLVFRDRLNNIKI